MKKRILLVLLALTVFGGVLAGCAKAEDSTTEETTTETSETDTKDIKTIKIGATAFPHVEIINIAKPLLAEKGYEVTVEEFSDYTLMNGAVNDKSLDANFFQHEPFLNEDIANHDYKISNIGKVHIEPMGVYSKKITKLDEIVDGDSIAIPNDESNGSRALLLLEKNGLITLKEGVEVPSLTDITENEKNLEFVEVDAATLPTTVADPKIAAAVINTNFALAADLNPTEDAIAIEDKDSPYANVIVVRTEDKDKGFAKALVEALNSEEVREYIEKELTSKGIVEAF